VAIYGEPSARVRYRAELTNNASFRKMIQRLEITRIGVKSFIQMLEHLLTAAGRPDAPRTGTPPPTATADLDALRERFQTLENDRKVVRGILFAQEVDEIDAKERSRALAYYAPKLGARSDEQPLTAAETAAFKTGDYGAAGSQVLGHKQSIIDRLKMVPGLRAPTGPTDFIDAAGTEIHVSRRLEGVMVLDGLTSEQTLLVGVVDDKTHAIVALVSVVPLNDAAVSALGGPGAQWVVNSRLIEATEAELDL
jgi:hypothetical protein